MKLKYFLAAGIIIAALALLTAQKRQAYESDWLSIPQTFGMFNYYEDTNISRLKAANCTVNGYRLIYNLKDFDIKRDIERCHKNSIIYIAGVLFSNKSELLAKKFIDFGADGIVLVQPINKTLLPDYIALLERLKSYPKRAIIGTAVHGESFIPLTYNLIPKSDICFINMELEERFNHQIIYKIYSNKTVVSAPVDASFGWLTDKSNKSEELIEIEMAEAYANKGAYNDQFGAGLRGTKYLCESIDAMAVGRINSFYLGNRQIFNRTALESVSKTAILLTDSNWYALNCVGNILSRRHANYDVIFKNISSADLEKYSTIVLAGASNISESNKKMLERFNGTVLKVNSDVDIKGVFLEDYELRDFINDSTLLPEDVGIQIWKLGSKFIVHLINYKFDMQKGAVERFNLSVRLPLNFTEAKLISPDINGSIALGKSIAIPKLRIWNVLILE